MPKLNEGYVNQGWELGLSVHGSTGSPRTV